MQNESQVFLYTILGLLFFGWGCELLTFLLERVLQRRWLESLDKPGLLRLEDQLEDCLKRAAIDPAQDSSIDKMIASLDFPVREKLFIPLREAYTAKQPEPGVYVRKFLPDNRRMHIIYKPEELDDHPAGRGVHSMFRLRDQEEQERDYMDAGLILPKDAFWRELTEAGYFEPSVEGRRQFVYRAARKYHVQPSMIFRRISELKVIMQ